MPSKYLRFTVEGEGTFPFDMLRYDSCYPEREEDSGRIHLNPFQLRSEAGTTRRVTLIRTNSTHATPARWASFGWRVVEQEVRSL